MLDPECTIKAATGLLKSDPGLVAFIMRTSNSVRYLLRQPPRDLDAAVLRIGLTTTASLATAYATRSMFTISTPVLKKLMINSYQNATKVSILSYLLAEKLRGFDADTAMLAGLLQDIAIPPLLTRLVDRPEIFNNTKKRTDVINKLSPVVSALILKHWGFENKIIDVVRARKQWDRNERDELDMGDIVLIARWYALLGTAEFSDCPPLSDIPAIQKFPSAELTHEKSLKLLEESRQEMKDLQQALQFAA